MIVCFLQSYVPCPYLDCVPGCVKSTFLLNMKFERGVLELVSGSPSQRLAIVAGKGLPSV